QTQELPDEHNTATPIADAMVKRQHEVGAQLVRQHGQPQHRLLRVVKYPAPSGPYFRLPVVERTSVQDPERNTRKPICDRTAGFAIRRFHHTGPKYRMPLLESA